MRILAAPRHRAEQSALKGGLSFFSVPSSGTADGYRRSQNLNGFSGHRILSLKESHATFWDQAGLEPEEAGVVSVSRPSESKSLETLS